MALSQSASTKAFYIFRDMLELKGEKLKSSWIQQHDEDDDLKEGYVIGYDPKLDDGWENVFINIKNISKEQLALFESRKREVPNSDFIRDKGNGITRIGFF